MKYYMVDTLGDVRNEDLCFSDNAPKPIGAYNLKSGNRLADEYPDGVGPVTLTLGEDYPGLETPSFLGNTDSLLIVKKDVADAILGCNAGELETLPFKLLNHKGRVHCNDYVFVNPVGTWDCLDMAKTACKRHADGSIMRIVRYVVSRSKLEGAPDILRVKETPARVVFTERLVTILRERKVTNLVVEELECT